MGLTREDYQRLRDNIKARLTRTLWFDAPIGQGTNASEDVALAEFAARYLNAARLDSAVLDEWIGGAAGAQPPSACEDCPNRTGCHASFGAIDGYGLYPLSPVALGRLYRRVVQSEGIARAFKPRKLIRVLADTLEEAERGLSRGDFPTGALIKAFGLGSTTAELELALRHEVGAEGDRILRAIELYAEQPAVARPVVPGGIATAFGMQLPVWSSRSTAAPVPAASAPRQEETSAPALDVYDQWLRGETPADKSVNAWRRTILDAVSAAIEWDVEGIAYLRPEFGARAIQIDGQKTRTADPVLVVVRTPEVAVTLRVLAEESVRQEASYEALLRTARFQIEEWAEEVRKNVDKRALPPSATNAIQVGMQLLAVGAFIRGQTSRAGVEGPLLDLCMHAEWDVESGRGRGEAWNAVVRAYVKFGVKVRGVIRHALSCTKGGQAGAMLDPSQVIATLHGLRRGALPSFVHDPGTQWGVFRDVGQLAREVAQHLSVAMDEELRAAEEWRKSIARHLGDDSPADVTTWIGEALEAATGAGLGDGSLRKAVADLQGRAVKGCLDSVEKVLAAPDETGRLVALGTLDRPLMKQLAEMADLAAKAMGELEIRLRQRLQDAHGGRTPDEWLVEIEDRLHRVESAYTELLGEDLTDG